MGGTADKVEYYLEKQLPELRKLERKGIFSEAEIKNIIAKRRGFEEKLNAPGARSTEFARYAEFELNLDALRKKRAGRMGILSGRLHSMNTVYRVLDRTTTKFHGDLGLWMLFLSVCRKEKAYSKIKDVITKVTRMFPTKSELWLYAALYHVEDQGDTKEAAKYLRKGLEFCKDSENMWLMYAKVYLIELSKPHLRKMILQSGDMREKVFMVENQDEDDENILSLSAATRDDPEERHESVQEDNDIAVSKVTPVSSGAIPMAIFDAALKHFKDPAFGARFFDMVLEFEGLPCRPGILDHIVDSLREEFPTSPTTLEYYIRRPLAGMHLSSSDYPQALTTSFSRLRSAMAEHPSAELLNRLVKWLVESLDGDVNEDIEQALLSILLRLLKSGQSSDMIGVSDVVTLLETDRQPNPNIMAICFDVWPEDHQLKAFTTSKIGKEAAALVQA